MFVLFAKWITRLKGQRESTNTSDQELRKHKRIVQLAMAKWLDIIRQRAFGKWNRERSNGMLMYWTYSGLSFDAIIPELDTRLWRDYLPQLLQAPVTKFWQRHQIGTPGVCPQLLRGSSILQCTVCSSCVLFCRHPVWGWTQQG